MGAAVFLDLVMALLGMETGFLGAALERVVFIFFETGPSSWSSSLSSLALRLTAADLGAALGAAFLGWGAALVAPFLEATGFLGASFFVAIAVFLGAAFLVALEAVELEAEDLVATALEALDLIFLAGGAMAASSMPSSAAPRLRAILARVARPSAGGVGADFLGGILYE